MLPWGGLLGLIWLVSPLVIAWLDRTIAEKPVIREKERGYLLYEAAQIWRYFEEYLTPENHYLPPDNVQQFPIQETAERTSPTNIGMALLSCLAAWELELTEETDALQLLQGMMDTMERLPKWSGHLYNWYDIKTLRPLQPVFISSVDSGNLCACLITLAQGLREKGQLELTGRGR